MNGFALFLFVVAAANTQICCGTVDATFRRATLGERPWYAHLRVAVRHTGEMRTCAGAVVHRHWLLTSARCVRYNRYIWVSFGVDLYRPTLVAETNTIRVFPQNVHATGAHDVAIINMTSHFVDVPNDFYAAPLVLAGINSTLPRTATFCSYGRLENGAPGVTLGCIELNLSLRDDGYILAESEEGWTTENDQGAPLVANGVQYGILQRVENNQKVAVFLSPVSYRDWFEEIMVTTLPVPVYDDDDEDDDDDNNDDNGSGNGAERGVKFVPFLVLVAALTCGSAAFSSMN